MNSAKWKSLASWLILSLSVAMEMCTGVPALAQVVGATVSGIVSDTSGAAVPGAELAIQNVGTGEVRRVSTNGTGFYSAPNLLPGDYDVTVTAKGFSTLVQKSVSLSVGQQLSLNPALKIGRATETIEVSDTPAMVQTSSSTLSATVDSTTIRELPLNGRDWTSLATREPGIVSLPTQVGTAFNANKGNRGFGNQLSDAGHRPYDNTYRVNGVVINDYSNGSPGGATGVNLGVDAIQEFSVLTADYTAEYGRTSGAVINAITKSGTNQFHGTGYFFDRDKIFDAKNYFDGPGDIPSFRRIQFGASGGTAIVKDKTFVFADYEGIRQNQPISTPIDVPTAALRATAVPAVQPYLSLWPLPPPGATITNGIATYDVALPTIANENYITTRVDQRFNANDSLAASYFFDSGPLTQPDPLQNVVHEVFSRRQMFSLEETHIFSTQLVNTARIGLSRITGDINSPVRAINTAANDPSLSIAPGAPATPQIAVAGLTNAVGLGGFNQFYHNWTSGQAYDDAFLTKGKHSIKMGFAFERMRYNILERSSPNGTIKYGNVADFLLNTPERLNALAPGGSNEVGIRESLFAGYVQDDWRARSNLTINLGLRYEMTTLPTEAKNGIQEVTSLTDCAASPTACTAVHVPTFIANNPTTKNFEPRVGFAWDPFGDGKTAVRSSFGIFDVLPLPYIFSINAAATTPFQIIGADPAAVLGTPSNNVSFNPALVRNRYVQQDPHRGYDMNWNLSIQREFAKNWSVMVGYVGSHSLHLPVSADDINLVQPLGFTSAGLLYPLPGTGVKLDPNAGGNAGIRPLIFDGASHYEGLQAQVRKDLSHGVLGQLSYTYGKCRDLSSAPSTGDPFLNAVAVPLLTVPAYRNGACDFDIRQVTAGTLVWDIPSPKSGSHLTSALIGGWELGTILTVTTGSPFTATVGAGGDPLGTGYNGDFSMDFATILPGCNPIHGGVNYLNLNCFALPTAPAAFASQCAGFPGAAQPAPAGTVYCSNLLGNAGRNSLYGPGLATVDASLFKNFAIPRISETFRIQFRAEFFNVLNHTNFGAPGFLNPAGQNNSIFDATGAPLATAGVLNSTSTSSRQIQLGAKVVW